MKKGIWLCFLVASFFIVIQSCTLKEKRYSKGYYVEWHKKNAKKLTENKEYSNTNFEASNNNHLFLPEKEQLSISAETICEDTLYLLDGGKIICEVVENGKEITTYNKCDEGVSTQHKINSSKIQRINYANGSIVIVNFPIGEYYPPNKVDFVKSNQSSNNCGDSIFMASGKLIKCKIIELTNSNLKYRKCNDTTNSIYTVERNKLYATAYEKSQYTKPTSSKPTYHWAAIVSFVSAILSFIPFWLIFPWLILITILPALIFGLIALKEIEKSYGTKRGKIMAIFGIVLASIIILLIAFWIWLYYFVELSYGF